MSAGIPYGFTIVTSVTDCVLVCVSVVCCESIPHPANTVAITIVQSTTNENRFIGPPLYRHNLITYIISFIRRIVKINVLQVPRQSICEVSDTCLHQEHR